MLDPMRARGLSSARRGRSVAESSALSGWFGAAALATALLPGCDSRDRAPDVPVQRAGAANETNAALPVPAPVPPPLGALRGDWVLVSIDGEPRPPRSDYVHMTFLEGRIQASSQCIPFRWLYAHAEGRLRIDKERYPGPICMRPLSAWERRFEEAMGAAASIALAPDGTLIVTGAKGSLRFQRE